MAPWRAAAGTNALREQHPTQLEGEP
jgi:hypothetical protein